MKFNIPTNLNPLKLANKAKIEIRINAFVSVALIAVVLHVAANAVEVGVAKKKSIKTKINGMK